MLQTSMTGVQATYSDSRGQWAVATRNRKTAAIKGRRSIQALHPNPPDYSIPSSSRRRKRIGSEESEEGTRNSNGEEGASRDDEDGEHGDEGASQDNEDGVGNHGSTSTLISFEKVLARGSIHTAECCRLSLPRAFCERYNVESDVTVTDSAGSRLWRMRFQSYGVWKASRPPVFTISDGWREFSYDHSLKVNDRVVFTLLSTSHFLVEFATSDGSSRAMLPTRDGEDYLWKLNYAILDCLSNANEVDASQVMLQAVQEKVIRKNIMASITSAEGKFEEEFRQHTVAPITLQEDNKGVIRIKTVARVTLEDGAEREVIQKNAAPITLEDEGVQGLIRKGAAPITLNGDDQEELIRRESQITIPNKQQLQKEMYCQCDTAKIHKGVNTRSDTIWKEYVLPEFTHLECKNADGSSYLQIIDSDSEIT